MNALCTYCSYSKRDDAGEMPAIRRYTSTRIGRVYEASTILGVGFCILSGEYGLLLPEQPIPNYDHLLMSHEVASLAARVAEQIPELGLEGIVYMTHALASDDKLVPYRDVIVTASLRARIPCLVMEMPLRP